MKIVNEVISWIKENKSIFIIVLVIGGLIASSLLLVFGGMRGMRLAAREIPTKPVPREKIPVKPELKIKKGKASISSVDSQADYRKISQQARSLNGWVDRMSKSENYKRITVRATFKIPAEKFDSFANWLLNNFKVTSSNFGFYRKAIKREKEEIKILKQELNVYNDLIERAKGMVVSVKQIKLINRLTQEKLNTVKDLKRYGYKVGKIKAKAMYATLAATIIQKKKIKIIPKDFWRNFISKLREKLSWMLTSLASIAMDLATVTVVIISTVIQWIIYIIVALVPIFVAYKYGRKLFEWIDKKISK